MERPTLNPSLALEPDAPRRRRPGLLKRAIRATASLALALLTHLFTPLTTLLGKARPEHEEHSTFTRILRGFVYRATAASVLAAIAVALQIYIATHPPSAGSPANPSSLGLYFQPIALTAADGVTSPSWFVPALDSERVLDNPALALESQSPAVILIHDQSTGPDQLLDYLRPLHAAGIATLTLAPRGAGESPQALGLIESRDIAAALTYLRSRPTINPHRIALLGTGTGATAALLTAKSDSALAAIVALNPAPNTDVLLASLTPPKPLTFLRPLTRWTFESAFNVDADDADLTRLAARLRGRPVLYLLPPEYPTPRTAERNTALHFLTSYLTAQPPAAAASN